MTSLNHAERLKTMGPAPIVTRFAGVRHEIVIADDDIMPFSSQSWLGSSEQHRARAKRISALVTPLQGLASAGRDRPDRVYARLATNAASCRCRSLDSGRSRPGPRRGCRRRARYTSSYFTLRQSRSAKMLSRHAPRPSAPDKKIVLERQLADFRMQALHIHHRSRLGVGDSPDAPEAPSRNCVRHYVVWFGGTSNCSTSVLARLMAASATFALKAGLWFRRARLLMVAPRHDADGVRMIHSNPLFRFPEPAV